MAEDRMIRAELRTSATVNSWPIPLRFFWTQLWGYCDDYGRGLYDPKVIVAGTFPLDDEVTFQTVSHWMVDLESAEVIRCYTVAGRQYFECVNWDEHQTLRYRKKSKIPPPTEISQSSETFGNFAPQVEGEVEEEEKKKGESVTAPPPFCIKHPGGTDDPCRACGNARRARAAWDDAEKNKPTPSPVPLRELRARCKAEGHINDGYGYCTRCQERAE